MDATTNHKDLLIKLLGLDEKATDEAITNAATTFQADMVAFKHDADGQIATLTNAKDTAEKAATDIAVEAKEMAEELVNYDLEKYKDAITNADDMKANLMTNRNATIAILKNVKIANTAPRQHAAPLHDPKVVNQPDPVINTAPKADEATAKLISNRARELCNSLKCSHQQAWDMAKAEQADKITNAK